MRTKRYIALTISLLLSVTLLTSMLKATEIKVDASAFSKEDTVVLRVCNWEEYIDEGEWEEDELIELEDCDIFGENPLYEDFQDWYYEKTGKRVIVEYSCFGTNEELYNMLTIGDVYDLVCPSDYMIMKLMSEDALVPYSDEFFDESNPENYYINGVSGFIRDEFENSEINGEPWSKYAAGYMWGVTGMLYNPDEVAPEDVATWQIINNPDYARQVTVKDNVRDTMFAAMGAIKSELLKSDDFKALPDYRNRLKSEMNDVSEETIARLQEYLQDTKDNAYSFESDSGKADMITGKVLANLQWSGDAVYAMDQAEEDDYYLEYSVPEECTNLWFDGWVMLKNGIEEDPEKQAAAEAFVNFLSMPENAVRNMYYIGYTSVISGGDSDIVFEYVDYTYSADPEEEDPEDLVEYPVGFYFSGDNEDENYVILTTEDQTRRQLFAQYPTQEVIDRSAVMWYFDKEANANVNQMWINIRCLNVKDIPVWAWIIGGLVFAGLICMLVRSKIKNKK